MSDRNDIIAAANAGTLPELFVERLRRHRTDELGKAVRATLAKLHNDGTIDVLEPARQIATSPINQHDFFTVMHVYSELIPALDASVPDMLAAVKALSTRAGEDLASGMANGGYRTWAEQGGRARDTFETIKPEDGDDSAYVFLALQALAKTEPDAALDRAILYVGGNAGPAQSAAAKAIGTFDLTDPDRRTRATHALAAHAASADDNSLGHILAAICEIAKAHPDTHTKAAALIDANIERTGDHAIHQLSLELMFHADELPPAIVKPLTAIMHRVPIGNRGTIRDIGAAAGNRALLSPIGDWQAIDIGLAFTLLACRPGAHGAIDQWAEELAKHSMFAFKTHGRYPITSRSYWDLVDHPSERSDEYRTQSTEGSILYAFRPDGTVEIAQALHLHHQFVLAQAGILCA